jgi:uncharacterized protein YndB with AHSA1/START domain
MASNKQSNHHFSFTVGVNATPNKVWQTLTDVSSWHIWDTELIEASLEGRFEVGAKGILIPKKGPKLPFYISEITPHHSYSFKTKMPIGSLDITRTLKVENGTTYFTDDIAFKGLLKHIFGFMLGGGFRKVLPDVMDNFKNLAEKS